MLPDSKAVVSVLFLFCVALWFILRGASCFKDFPCSLFLCFGIPFSIVRISFCHFSLLPGVGGLAAVCDCGTPWTFLLNI